MSATEQELAEFRDAILGLKRGDFSRLEPLFQESALTARSTCHIVDWIRGKLFEDEPVALAEALTCACFLGRTDVARFLLDEGVDPAAGLGTGMNALHWAANRGQFATVKLLIERNVPLETKNMYGGTVLGTAVWSAIHEPKPNHPEIIQILIAAGASLEGAGYPTGHEKMDDLLLRQGADE